MGLRDKNNQTPIPKRLAEALKRSGMNQTELGLESGFGDSASPRVNQYVKGIHEPGYGVVKRMASALELPTAYFYAEEDDLAELIYRFAARNRR